MDQELFDRFIRVIEGLTGMAPPVSHRNHIKRELETIFRREGLDPQTFLDQASRNGEAAQKLINISTINETYFFREEKQFQLLAETILPELYARKRHITIWSVSCSTGEEPLSLALLAREGAKAFPGRNFTVYASDINSRVLDHFSNGRFTMRALRNDGSSFHSLLLSSGEREKSGPEEYFLPHPSIMEHIRIQKLNIRQDRIDFLSSPADLVFFRNTLLYMPMEGRGEIISRIGAAMAPEAYLFLASSEVPYVKSPLLEQEERGGIYFFRRGSLDKAQEPPGPSRNGDVRSSLSSVPVLLPGQDHNVQEPPGLEPQHRGGREIRSDRELLSRLSGNSPGETTGIARQIEQIMAWINLSAFEDAEAALCELEKKIGELGIFHLLKGFIAKARGDRDEALSCFGRAIEIYPELWPARYFQAHLLREAGKMNEALEEFQACMEAIEEASSRTAAEELLLFCEGFDISYFTKICSSWIGKIKDTRQVRV